MPQPPQQAIEQGEPLRVAVQDRDLRQFDEFGRYVEGAVRRFQRRCRRLEQFGRVACDVPGHVGRFHVVQRQRAGGFAPAVEIGFAVEGDDVHVASFSSLRANGSRECALDDRLREAIHFSTC